MSASINQLIPELQPYAVELVRAAGAAGLQPRITSTRRSSAEQARLYRRYQQGLQQYPVAPPGTSAHEFGFAFDMVVADLRTLPDVGSYWKDLGGVWGGEFNDPIHFEYPGFKASSSASGSIADAWPFTSIRALLDFIDSLPWYLNILLPSKLTFTAKKDPQQAVAILRNIGAIQ